MNDQVDLSASTHSLPWCQFFNSTLGKKVIMAITGLLLSLFLIAHLLGNTLLVFDPDAFNLYGHKLTSTPLIYLAEFGLLAIFFLHLYTAFTLVWRNRQARPQAYAMKVKSGEGANFFSRSMPYTGLSILIFLITHLIHFKYGNYYTAVVEGQEVRDLYRTVLEYFASHWNTLWYLLCMVLLSFHLFHGIPSTFQSLGWRHPKWFGLLQKLGITLAITVPLGFLFICVWCHWTANNS